MSTAILKTACGCERIVDIPDGVHDWHAVLYSRPRFDWSMQKDNALSTEVLHKIARRFCWRGQTKIMHDPPHHPVRLRVFEEVDDAVGIEMPAPPKHLTYGEWADACARWSQRTDFSRGLAEADQEFLARHDGATILQHESGVLVGAFYIAPSWDNSHMAVSIFSALRQLDLLKEDE